METASNERVVESEPSSEKRFPTTWARPLRHASSRNAKQNEPRNSYDTNGPVRMKASSNISHSPTNRNPAYEQKKELVLAPSVVSPGCFVVAHLIKKVPYYQPLVTCFSFLRPKDGAMSRLMDV